MIEPNEIYRHKLNGRLLQVEQVSADNVWAVCQWLSDSNRTPMGQMQMPVRTLQVEYYRVKPDKQV